MRMAKLAQIYGEGKEKFPKLHDLEKRGLAVGAYLQMIDGAFDALAEVEDYWGSELEGSHKFRWVHSYWCASAVIYHLYRFFEPLKSWPDSVQKWFDCDETEVQNQLYLKSAEEYAARQDEEVWDYKNLRREMGCAVDDLVRFVEPIELKIDVCVEDAEQNSVPCSTATGDGFDDFPF